MAVLRTLPIAEQDEESLEMFGTSVMDIWGPPRLVVDSRESTSMIGRWTLRNSHVVVSHLSDAC